MTNPLNLLAVMLNVVMLLALAAILITPKIFFYAALGAAPMMLGILIFITLTPQANAPTAMVKHKQ